MTFKETEKYVSSFLAASKIFLSNQYFSKSKNGSSLMDVYPYIFEEDEIIENQTVISSASNISELYENIVPTAIKKDLGQFYTNDTNIIEMMLSSLDLMSGKILEPSCGVGAFCTKIIEKLISKRLPAEFLLTYITDNLYSNDIDINATKIAEINMLSTLLPLIVEAKNINPLFSMKRLKLFNYDFTKKNLFSEKFKVVIGNPPFVTMYGKRSRNMNEEKRAYYNTFDFVQNKKGNNKFNLSMFFIENGLKSLDKEGQLSFILDLSFLETAFVDMRKYIVQNYHISSFTFGFQGFQNVASGQVIINILNTKNANSKIDVIDLSTDKEYTINQADWNKSENDYKFSLPLDNLQQCINEKINKYKPLSFYYPGKSLRTCCALTGKTEEFIVNDTSFSGLIFPYLEGSKGIQGKFCKPTPSFSIKYDYDLQIKLSDEFKHELEAIGVKNKKRVTLGDKDAYLAPKLFIRQSAKEIIATYSDEPFAANNSIYILTNKKSDDLSIKMLKYTCGLLNSDLISFYCRINKIIRAEKGQTPQIKISDLKKIKLNINNTYYYDIIDIVDKLIINPDDKFLLQTLNSLVYKAYKITDHEISYIDQYLRA